MTPTYKISMTRPIGTFEFVTVDIKNGESGDATQDRCFIEGVWRETSPQAEWAFSGALSPFKST